jgi:predicted SpoU family rRNA methylase
MEEITYYPITSKGKFVCELYEKNTDEILKIIKTTINETIPILLTMYATHLDDVVNKVDEYNKIGNEKVTIINYALRCLQLKDNNQTRRYMYEECLKFAFRELTFCYEQNDVKLWATQETRLNNFVLFQKNLEQIKNTEPAEMIETYKNNMKMMNSYDNKSYLAVYNYKIDMVIESMMMILTKLDTYNNNDSNYM